MLAPFRVAHGPSGYVAGQQARPLQGAVAPEELLERLFKKYGGDREAEANEDQTPEFQAKACALQQKYLQQGHAATARRVVVRPGQATATVTPASAMVADASSQTSLEASEIRCGSASASSTSSGCGGITREVLVWPGSATPALVPFTPEKPRSCSPGVRRLSSGGRLSFLGSANSYQPPLAAVVVATASPGSPMDRAGASTPSRLHSPGGCRSVSFVSPPRMVSSLRLRSISRSMSLDKIATPPVPPGTPLVSLGLATPQRGTPDAGSAQRSGSASPRPSLCSLASAATVQLASPRLRRHSSMQSSPFLSRVWQHPASPGRPPPPVALLAVPTPQTALFGRFGSAAVTATVSAAPRPRCGESVGMPTVPAVPLIHANAAAATSAVDTGIMQVRAPSPQPRRPAVFFSSHSGKPLQERSLTPATLSRRLSHSHGESCKDLAIGPMSL